MTLRWGVLATGGIAARFTEDLRLLTGPDAAEVIAVGSRDAGRAKEFAAAHGVPRAYGSYDELVADQDVDVVYVATPHPGHHDAAMLAIDAGRAVLLEKPFTMNATEARSLVAAARTRGTFLMEAMWTRFLPPVVRLRELIAAGAIGEPRVVVAENCQFFPFDAEHRLYAAELGGGALLDLGVYAVSFVSMVLGAPTGVLAAATPAPTGVDATSSALLTYDDGAHGLAVSSVLGKGPNRAAVIGTEGNIDVDGTFFRTPALTVTRRGGEPQREEFAWDGHGMYFEAAEVGRCLAGGLLESDVMPLEETVSIMETLDEVRRQIGLDYSAL